MEEIKKPMAMSGEDVAIRNAAGYTTKFYSAYEIDTYLSQLKMEIRKEERQRAVKITMSRCFEDKYGCNFMQRFIQELKGEDSITNEFSEKDKIEPLVKEFLQILNTTEESDSGTEFHPVFISSCRVMKTKRLGEILTKLKELVGE